MDDETPDFIPAEMPKRIDIQLPHARDAIKVLYHLIGAGYWYYKRERANEKLAKHAQFFEHETEVTDFKRKLDEED